MFCKQKDGKLSKEDLIQMLSAMLVVRSENRASHELVGFYFIKNIQSDIVISEIEVNNVKVFFIISISQ